MNLKLLLVLTVTLVLQSTGGLAYTLYFTHREILAALQSQPLVVMLQDENPQELKRMADKPAELAQYKASVAMHNNQAQQLIRQFWTVSSNIEFKSESELPALQKDKQHATLVLYRKQLRLGYSDSRVGTFLETEWRLDLAGGRREVYSFDAPLPPTTVTAADIISALRNLQFQIRDEQVRMTKTEQPKAKVQLRDYSQRLRTKTLLIDKEGLKDKFTETNLQKAYPYPHRLATPEEIEAAVLTADPRYTYVRNLSSFTYVIDAATGEQLTGVEGDMKWGAGEFSRFVAAIKRGE